MQDPTMLIAVASTAVAGVGITSAAALKGWQDWLDVRRLQVGAAAHEPSPAGSRIEVADRPQGCLIRATLPDPEHPPAPAPTPAGSP